MASISFGGDPESYMDPPRMENKALSDVIGGNPIAMLFELVGINRQVAKAPKTQAGESAEGAAPAPKAEASVPSVLTDLTSALSAKESPLVPMDFNTSLPSTWGQRWLQQMKPITQIDPNDAHGR